MNANPEPIDTVRVNAMQWAVAALVTAESAFSGRAFSIHSSDAAIEDAREIWGRAMGNRDDVMTMDDMDQVVETACRWFIERRERRQHEQVSNEE